MTQAFKAERLPSDDTRPDLSAKGFRGAKRMDPSEHRPQLIKILTFLGLLALGIGWHSRCSRVAEDRWMEVEGLEVLVPAGSVVSFSGRAFDRPSPNRPRSAERALRVTRPELEEGFLLVEDSPWRGGSSPGKWIAEVYPRLEGPVLKAYPPVRVLAQPDFFQAGSIKAYGGTWQTQDGSEVGHLREARLSPPSSLSITPSG